MVVANITDYSIRLNWQNIPSVMINTTENQYVKVYRVKSTKLQSLWKGPPYLIAAVKPSEIKDRKSESWIHHDRLELCEDREFPIWLKRQRNDLMNGTVENEEFDLTGLLLFEQDDAAMSASDPLMSHTGINQDIASASYFLMPQTDNGQGSVSAPYHLVSRGAVDDNDMPEEFNIFDRGIIEGLNKLHNDHDNS